LTHVGAVAALEGNMMQSLAPSIVVALAFLVPGFQAGLWANPDGKRGREKVAAVLSHWGRYRIVDDPLAADLILVVFETQKNLNLIKRANLVAELKAYPGGAILTEETPVLWSGEAREGFRKMPSTQVAEKFKDHVIKLENSRSGVQMIR
jgi:hypothetical protein